MDMAWNQDGWDDGNALPNVPIRFHAALSTETAVLVSSCVRLRVTVILAIVFFWNIIIIQNILLDIQNMIVIWLTPVNSSHWYITMFLNCPIYSGLANQSSARKIDVGCPLGAPLARQVWKVLEAVFTAFFTGEIVAGTEDSGAQKTLEKTISIIYIYMICYYTF